MLTPGRHRATSEKGLILKWLTLRSARMLCTQTIEKYLRNQVTRPTFISHGALCIYTMSILRRFFLSPHLRVKLLALAKPRSFHRLFSAAS